MDGPTRISFGKKNRPMRNTINIGWYGTNAQLEDLVLIRRFIIRIIREFPQYAGRGHWQSTRVSSVRWIAGKPKMYLPAVSHEEFPYQLSQVDILLVPLRNYAIQPFPA
jgi:hypothetical protein